MMRHEFDGHSLALVKVSFLLLFRTLKRYEVLLFNIRIKVYEC